MLTNVYVGMAEGALDATRADLRGEARPAQVLADAAASALDDAFAHGPDLTRRERSDVAAVVAEAKAVAHKAAIGIGSRLFGTLPEPMAYA
jgi:hypothetical protein